MDNIEKKKLEHLTMKIYKAFLVFLKGPIGKEIEEYNNVM